MRVPGADLLGAARRAGRTRDRKIGFAREVVDPEVSDVLIGAVAKVETDAVTLSLSRDEVGGLA
jgi:hypothetical protein